MYARSTESMVKVYILSFELGINRIEIVKFRFD
jgi:hypothetical protein